MPIVLILIALLAFLPRSNSLSINRKKSDLKGRIVFYGTWKYRIPELKSFPDYDFFVEVEGWKENKTANGVIYSPLKVRGDGTWDFTNADLQKRSDEAIQKYKGLGGLTEIEWEVEFDPSFETHARNDAKWDEIEAYAKTALKAYLKKVLKTELDI
tara:strand:- start:2263 stop:2730 length:468 start_codon:yes stop_codon:yes gene_type:complete